MTLKITHDPLAYTYWWKIGTSYDGTVPPLTTLYARDKSGVTVPGWRKKLADGVNASSPYSCDLHRMAGNWNGEHAIAVRNIITPSNKQAFNYSGHLSLARGNSNYLVPSIGLTASDEAQALDRLYNKIRQESYGINGLLFLGELREAIHMLRHPADAMHKAVSGYLNVLKSVRKDTARRLKQRKGESDIYFVRRRLDHVRKGMSGSWLELQFGVKPFLSDMADIAQTAVDLYTKPRKKDRVTGRSTVRSDVISTDSIFKRVNSWAIIQNRSKKETSVSLQYKVGMKHQIDAPIAGLTNVKDAFGFQWQNFIPTIYELIPYSFLVDYFLNLGNVISAACTDTSSIDWISRTQRTKVQFEESNQMLYSNGDSAWELDSFQSFPSRFALNRVILTRTIPDSLPLPPFVLSVPGADSLKWFNMAALLGGARDFRFRR